ncbi:DUF3883 domain-containing protein [Xenorhabdus sp. 38]|nr:DUF3883 domain-containing protein [Xenorhabdus sp. 38]
MKKILWVKFGWSNDYCGGPVDGNFYWLDDNKEKRGNEAFNFAPESDGTYYCYVPPQTGKYALSNNDPDGWTVICLAKNPKYPGIHIVGWYEDATLHGEFLDLPDNIIKMQRNAVGQVNDWSYCITSKTAYFIPHEVRNMPFSDGSIRQGKYSFLEGPSVNTTDDKKRVLNLLENRLKEMSLLAIKNPGKDNLPDLELGVIDPLKGFGTPAHRKAVEKAAERAVIKHYTTKGYGCERVTHLPCGYDFVFTKDGESELHVEVKGTAGSSSQFFLTRNEHQKGLQSNPKWRLVMVTSALTTIPDITEYDSNEIEQVFDIEPYVYTGSLSRKRKN